MIPFNGIQRRKSMNKYVRFIIAAVVLVGLASLACVSTPAKKTVSDIKEHGYYEGLTNWKYFYDGTLENETKFSYDDDGNLTEIKVYNMDKPLVYSYIEYFTVDKTDDADDEDYDDDEADDDDEGEMESDTITYRVLTKQEYFDVARNSRIWVKEIEITVVNNYPLIKKLTKTGINGVLIYTDEYEYDEMGRTLSAERTYKSGKKAKHEYSYNDANTLGLKKDRHYFDTPEVYFSRHKYIKFVTDADKKMKLKELPGFWYNGSYYYVDIY
jgi:hypothetical protein